MLKESKSDLIRSYPYHKQRPAVKLGEESAEAHPAKRGRNLRPSPRKTPEG